MKGFLLFLAGLVVIATLVRSFNEKIHNKKLVGEDRWDLEKHQCNDCNKQFIVGIDIFSTKDKEIQKRPEEKQPQCPYCGSHNTDVIEWPYDKNEKKGKVWIIRTEE